MDLYQVESIMLLLKKVEYLPTLMACQYLSSKNYMGISVFEIPLEPSGTTFYSCWHPHHTQDKVDSMTCLITSGVILVQRSADSTIS